MTYQDIHPARFIARPNRFIARVELDGGEETVHVKNTGRSKELLLPGCTVYLEGSANPQRKTKFDLVAVEKLRPDGKSLLINMDAQAPNKVFGEWMAAGLGAELGLPKPSLLRPETTWGNSRFDFYWECRQGNVRFAPLPPEWRRKLRPLPCPSSPHKAKGRLCGGPKLPKNKTYVSRETSAPRRGFVEVKGCTLEENGLALFPDAPTERGVKHLRELIACHEAGYEAAVCVVVQMEGMTAFSPNDRTHPEFGAALREAARAGVKVLAVECAVTPNGLTMTRPVPVRL